MTLTEVLPHLPSQWASTVVLFFLAIGVIGKLAESSNGFAKLLGPIGRWIQGRAERKVQRIRDERAERRTGEAADLADLRRQVATLTERVRLVHQFAGYLAYDAEWHARAEIRYAGTDIHLSPHLNFEEWLAEHSELRSYYGATDDDVRTP